MKINLILLAGGTGTRFGASIPKQFVEVESKPIIIYTLEKLRESKIDNIIIVCISDWIEHLHNLIQKFNINLNIRIIPGGNSAHSSIYKGLLEIEKNSNNDDIVVIHDAVRPLVPAEIIDSAVDSAIKYGNGCASLKTIEGLVVKDDEIHGSIIADRYNIMRIQTPQAYNFRLLKKLYDNAAKEGKEYPYADGICLNNNVPIYFSKSFTANTKITTKSDIAIFKALLHFTDKELLGEE